MIARRVGGARVESPGHIKLFVKRDHIVGRIASVEGAAHCDDQLVWIYSIFLEGSIQVVDIVILGLSFTNRSAVKGLSALAIDLNHVRATCHSRSAQTEANPTALVHDKSD